MAENLQPATQSFAAGVDEAGRGPLAGRVYAAAVILGDFVVDLPTLDSKRLSEKRRETLFDDIRGNAAAWSITWAEVEEIDRLNILHATMLAMQRAVAALNLRPACVLVDGNRAPEFGLATRCIVGGDAAEPCIGAASILAKVARDRYMLELAELYPQYGFAQHKGYPTRSHVEALQVHGVSPVHRRSFGPVARVIAA